MRKKVVLVVDDEKQIEEMVEAFLVKRGYQAISFTDPEHAFRFLQKHSDMVDLVISDIKMPGLNGRELSRKVFDVDSRIPVILLTGYPDGNVDGVPNIRKVLEKPVMKNDLTDAVAEIIGSPRREGVRAARQ